ncbi:hypothetical protein OHA72_05920 [Dactylosporangium sp. NBC_01737]|uniref:hypothetical protein n=1 Tax=Dactylosporangium sp. NBC_01737 TaxID=2975959 RepID=UPI002E148C9E|nr:hypothetical protein OHA72_05920 [Dactylosporangium sp. NBC_01737]
MKPHWRTDEQWTGFVLLLVPTSAAGIDIESLHRHVKRWARSDLDLADVTSVAFSLPVQAGDHHDASMIVRSFERAATMPGHLMAPRVVFGCVVLDESADEAQRLAGLLAEAPRLEEMPVYFFGVGTGSASADPDTPSQSAHGQKLVDTVTGCLREVVSAFERLPTFAIAEKAYYELTEQWRGVASAPVPVRSALPSAAETPTVVDTRKSASRPIAAVDQPASRSLDRGPEAASSAHPPRPRRRRMWASRADTPVATPPRVERARDPDVDAVAVADSDMRSGWFSLDVNDVLRKTVGKLGARKQKPSDPEVLDRVAFSGGNVELFYIVLIADGAQTSPGRRRDVVLAIDQRLGQIRHDAGRSIEVAAFTAGRRLRRDGTLRSAGQLTKQDVPRLPVEHFDLVDCVSELLEARERELSALARRGATVSAVRVCLMSTTVPLADISALSRMADLCKAASVTWILFDAEPALMSAAFAEAGVLVLEDHSDVAGELIDRMFTPAPGAP